MSHIPYYLVSHESGEANVTAFFPGDADPKITTNKNANWEKIVNGLIKGDESVKDLFDLETAVAARFDKISDRVSVANGIVYFDGDEVDNSLTKQIVRFINDQVNDWQGLVAFMEKVYTNPNEHSRKMLYDWLNAHDFTITPDGDIVGYKGVVKKGEGNFVSLHSGTATVDGTVHTGQIPNPIGAVVEMPRGDVTFNPGESCSYGLHVGTYQYAQSYNRGAMLEVHVNPRDVVSVPTDAGGEKVRVCRYVVVDTLNAPYGSAITMDSDEYGDDEYGVYDESLDVYCPECGENGDWCECEEDDYPEPEDYFRQIPHEPRQTPYEKYFS